MHIDDFIRISEEQNISCGEIVSYYERKALKNSRPNYTPNIFDYVKAYQSTIKKFEKSEGE